jgi:hypothetical protein
MGIVLVKPGVQFAHIDPAGFRLLGSLDRVARANLFDLTITCACEGHAADDPHTLGRAYDVRTHDLSPSEKQRVLKDVLLDLQDGARDAPMATSGGWATTHFFGWLEHADLASEHLHFQQRRGVPFV